ncbi:MAG: HypC/HybG/HupF family hydrogenase formation chaperone [Oceanospirillaceae bacterium]|uniref:HypC/HybG/HupF family hydrogenase formation chaperone n=1 Tax=unclassified Thalassolituus TaxID=2624967 RepID=UPI000C3F26F2|nr:MULTISPECIES: HypC/HybG/HupF family hydrogenase formation chaperone [unclassified Thalassolituus]MAX97751.1 HypC/HybG/HupF family hydrogenase formation chaperone [Oceanospirillaceae bacterium]MBL33893.1 HypC/HybG/HupF family hydrogenase formation chaperone [Oceanospirillaceae bacterium]MBL34779.1 HypC/HybG/HupF family hydrogenase formation chaperone [Oceanospirillaceae bacterium]MBS52853.1 HypC/HybG/HupF family hydrogenase formation chaperone [Oceanospirillaceae bacterium]|tara:strand:+ start:441 stop:689 length:249 start_codon:yes stop_codon:yes gene_type:complete
MCLAIPVKIERIEDDSTAIADIGGLLKAINISLVADVKAGDYVILHVGFALKKLDEEEAQKTLAMISDIDLHNARTEAAAGI